MAAGWMYGGVRVSRSQFGEVLFFMLGAAAGTAPTAVILVFASPHLSGSVRRAGAVLLSAAVGCVVGSSVLGFLARIFVTIPIELLELLIE